MKLLVTGFTPFGGETINPSWEAVSGLPEAIDGHRIITCRLTTAFETAAEELEEALARHMPQALLCVGQAGGRAGISIEKVAINYAEGIPEDPGAALPGETILPGGKDAYFSTLPVKDMVAAIRAAGIPAGLSFTAGTYVCNYILYTALHLAEHRFAGLRCGFVHIPYAPAQAIARNAPSMPLDMTRAALVAAIRAAAGAGDAEPMG